MSKAFGWIAFTISIAALAGCEAPLDDGLSSDPREARDPQGAAALRSLSDADVASALGWASLEIDEGRAIGVQKLISKLSAALSARGIDATRVAAIDDRYVAAARPLQSYRAASASSRGQQRHALEQDAGELGPAALRQYFECPIMAPDEQTGVICADIIDPVLGDLQQDIDADDPLEPDPDEEINGGAAEDEPGAEAEQLGEEDLGEDPGLDEEELGAEDEVFAGPTTARRFIRAWGTAAELFGARVAAMYAEEVLQGEGSCDARPNAKAVANALGKEQGASIVLALTPAALQQAQGCAINTDRIADRVRDQARAQVTTFMEQNKVCAEVDLNAQNAVLQQAERWRREAIFNGIERQVQILKQELFQARRAVDCCGDTERRAATDDQHPIGSTCDLVLRDGLSNKLPTWQDVLGNRVCCRHRRATERLACRGAGSNPLFCGEGPDGKMFCQCQAIPLGSPLVLDLDDDGLELTQQPVTFDVLAAGDGGQRCTWVGRREALLARDVDRDGAIGSGAELFGDHSDCGGRRCYDGVEALAQWDAPAQGGNGDGRIDARDRVFSELRLWIDANHDGVSTADELATLPARGVEAIDLQAEARDDRRAEGVISARLDVHTRQGRRSAYDVWFKLDLRGDQLAQLLPQR